MFLAAVALADGLIVGRFDKKKGVGISDQISDVNISRKQAVARQLPGGELAIVSVCFRASACPFGSPRLTPSLLALLTYPSPFLVLHGQAGVNDLRVLTAAGAKVDVSKTDGAAVALSFGDIIELDGFKAYNATRYPQGPETAFAVVV